MATKTKDATATEPKPTDCTCGSKAAPMYHGRECPVFLKWKTDDINEHKPKAQGKP